MKQTAKNKKQVTLRIDEEILNKFREMANEGDSSYQTLINKALNEWLMAKDFKDLLREDLDKFKEELRNLK